MNLTDLITRVDQGSGSDRQLDADICVELNWANTKQEPFLVVHYREKGVGVVAVCYENGGAGNPCDALHLTSSLDAIRALFKARLDGYCAHIYDDGYPHACVFARGYQLTTAGTDIHRAFLAAVLKAIAAKEG